MQIAFRYLHFLGVILLCGALAAEFVLLKPRLSLPEIRKLANVDAVFGLSSVLILGAGLMQWFHGGKPSGFYGHNPVFIAKISLFALAAIISIYPTVFFLKSRKGTEGEIKVVPIGVGRVIKLEAAIIAAIPLLAVLMARGVGLR